MERGCEKCDYNGYVLISDSNGDTLIKNCECTEEAGRESILTRSNIPRRYWEFGIEDIDKDHIEANKQSFEKISQYIKNIKANIKGGTGFWVQSNPGLGKSTILCSILKKASSLGYRPYFLKASKITSMKYDSLRDKSVSKLLDYIVDEVDILAIEEIDKVYLPEKNQKTDMYSMTNVVFFNFLSDVYDSGKSLLISSNLSRSKVISTYNFDILDRLREYPLIKITGTSARQINKADR
jgi:DNA replication protein DnaC